MDTGPDPVPLPLTERLRLRRIDAHDVDALVELDADPEVRRYVSADPPPDAAAVRREILPGMVETFGHSPFGFFAALDRTADDTFVGWFHLRPDADGPDVLDLGFRLRREVWGRGLATEGGRALVAWGFAHPRVRRITGHCLEANVASARVLQKCGLRFAGRFVVPASRLPGWPASRRRAVAYAVDRPDR